MEATYLGDIELTDETLAHYGVKGMKWGRHKNSKIKPIKRYRKQGWKTDTPLTNLITDIGGKVSDDLVNRNTKVGKLIKFMDSPVRLEAEAATTDSSNSEVYWATGPDGKWHKYKNGKMVK